MCKLKEDFYLRSDVVLIAKELLGKYLVSCVDGQVTAGLIIETEAYKGITDKASHAFAGRRTDRTEVMFRKGARSYVYLCYGLHHLFNVVTNDAEIPHAVLIRAVLPIEGKRLMCERRNKQIQNDQIADGPGKLTKAMGISMQHNNLSLLGDEVWIEDRNYDLKEEDVVISKRIGIDYAGEDADLPYRFSLRIRNIKKRP